MKKLTRFGIVALLFAVAGAAQAWWYPAPYPYYGYGMPYAPVNAQPNNAWSRSWSEAQATHMRSIQEMNQRARKEMDKAMQEMQAKRSEAEARRAEMIKEMQERRSKSKTKVGAENASAGADSV